MNNFRKVNNDFLKDQIRFREEELLGYLTKDDRKYRIDFDEISEKILKNVPNKNKKYVIKQLDLLDKNYINYISYWNEKYYRNGFCDAFELLNGCIKN